nr:hypothetical protein GCM10017745_03220 [Saccharothrix mutabilis subsp. capreolus]
MTTQPDPLTAFELDQVADFVLTLRAEGFLSTMSDQEAARWINARDTYRAVRSLLSEDAESSR